MRSKELFDALDAIMVNIVGMDYGIGDEDGICDAARAALADYRRENDTSYSVRCIETALKRRKLAHDLFKAARRYEALYPLSCGTRHVAWYDARTALRDAIQWIHAARRARITEQYREENNGFAHAAE